MELNEIKKELYKKNPTASILYIRKGNAHYEAELNGEKLYFIIPVEDMGDADFEPMMHSKHLIRWINK